MLKSVILITKDIFFAIHKLVFINKYFWKYLLGSIESSKKLELKDLHTNRDFLGCRKSNDIWFKSSIKKGEWLTRPLKKPNLKTF